MYSTTKQNPKSQQLLLETSKEDHAYSICTYEYVWIHEDSICNARHKREIYFFVSPTKVIILMIYKYTAPHTQKQQKKIFFFFLHFIIVSYKIALTFILLFSPLWKSAQHFFALPSPFAFFSAELMITNSNTVEHNNRCCKNDDDDDDECWWQ